MPLSDTVVTRLICQTMILPSPPPEARKPKAPSDSGMPPNVQDREKTEREWAAVWRISSNGLSGL